MSESDNPPAYLWTLQIASLIPRSLSGLVKAIRNELPERTRLGKALLAIEVSIILAGLGLSSPILGIILAELLALTFVFFIGRVLIRVLNWLDERVEELKVVFIDRAAPLLVRFIKWYRENAYKEASEYSA